MGFQDLSRSSFCSWVRWFFRSSSNMATEKPSIPPAAFLDFTVFQALCRVSGRQRVLKRELGMRVWFLVVLSQPDFEKFVVYGVTVFVAGDKFFFQQAF